MNLTSFNICEDSFEIELKRCASSWSKRALSRQSRKYKLDANPVGSIAQLATRCRIAVEAESMAGRWRSKSAYSNEVFTDHS